MRRREDQVRGHSDSGEWNHAGKGKAGVVLLWGGVLRVGVDGVVRGLPV